MRRVSIIAASTVVAALFLGAAGCSTSSTARDENKPAENALSKIDPCSLIKPEKANQAGLSAQGEPDTTISSQPGCYYSGEYANISVYRVADDNIDEFGNRSVWREFKRMKVNGRDGAEAHLPQDTENDCTTVVSAGGGVVMVNASPHDPRKPFEPCQESLKVAKLIEPDLPK